MSHAVDGISRLSSGARIGRAHLRVADLSRSVEFYTGALGFEVIRRADGEAALGAGGEELVVLYEHPGAGRKPKGTTGLYHYAILLPDRGSLARVLRRLSGHGWRLWGASDHLVSEALYLDDPDGNGIELYHDRPRSQWRWEGETIQMDTLRLDLQDLLAEAEGSGELPDGTRIGHVHLHVGDIERARRFYHEALGFDVTTLWANEALFLSAGGYHHHLGLNTWAGVDAPRAPSNTAGLERFEILLPGAEEPERVARRLEQAGESVEREEDHILTADPWGNVVSLRSIGPYAEAR